jgi:hypothetical protein
LGYRAQTEIHETPVLSLKVVNPSLPGMKISDPGEPRRWRFDDIKLHFTNMPVAVVPDILKNYFNLSVVDKTGLTNSYDFAFRFDDPTRRQMQDEATARACADRVLQELGLGLETDLEPTEILAVRPAALPAEFAERGRMFLGPRNPGAEEGAEHWYHGMSANGSLLTDNVDPAAGAGDFTMANSSTNGQSEADWRSEPFSLGPAANGAVQLRFSFAYKLPGPVKDGDNLRVQLRFFGSSTNFLDQKVFWVGSRSHDSAMTRYKTVTDDDVLAPDGSRFADVTLSANQYDDHWTSGAGRFDNIFVSIKAPPVFTFKRVGLISLVGLGVLAMPPFFLKLIRKRKAV